MDLALELLEVNSVQARQEMDRPSPDSRKDEENRDEGKHDRLEKIGREVVRNDSRLRREGE